MASTMLRGEMRLVDLDPVLCGEAHRRRPAVVVSNDHANAAAARSGRGVPTVVPLTSSTSRVWNRLPRLEIPSGTAAGSGGVVAEGPQLHRRGTGSWTGRQGVAWWSKKSRAAGLVVARASSK